MESWKITPTEESSENQQEEDSFGPSSNEESGSEPSISKNDTKIDDIEDKLHLVTDSKIWLHAQDRIKQVMETTDSLICITQVTVLFMDKLQSSKDLVTFLFMNGIFWKFLKTLWNICLACMPSFIKIVVLVFELVNFGKQTDIHLLLLGY